MRKSTSIFCNEEESISAPVFLTPSLPFPSQHVCRSLSASDKFMDKYLACEM